MKSELHIFKIEL